MTLEELVRQIAESQLALQKSVIEFVATADKYIEVSNARTSRLEDSLDIFLRAVTIERKKNGKENQ